MEKRFEYQGPYVFNSKDFKTELRHKVTGHKKSDFKAVYQQIEKAYYNRWSKIKKYGTQLVDGKLLYYEYGAYKLKPKPLYQRYRAQESDFEAVIIQGYQKIFESKQNSEYKRLMAEKYKKEHINQKKDEIAKAEKSYELIFQTEKKLREQKALNDEKILQHGFDLKTSFRK